MTDETRRETCCRCSKDMSGRGAGAPGGCSGSGHGRCSCGRGHGYQGLSSTCQTGLSKELGHNIFNYGKKGSANQMRTTWEKLCQYIGKEMSEDIATELCNKTEVAIMEPTHSAEVEACHMT